MQARDVENSKLVIVHRVTVNSIVRFKFKFESQVAAIILLSLLRCLR